MTLEADRNLLHYRLIEKIGEGSMGVVWKAVDTNLGRKVAVKVLPEMFAQQPDRLARFEHEAQLLAAGPESGSDASASQSPTMTSARTQAGMILGTAAYMSPEQARGKPVDRRGDIWALGCLLFEVAAAAVTALLYFAFPEEVRSSAVPVRFSFNLRGFQYGLRGICRGRWIYMKVWPFRPRAIFDP